MRSWGQYLQVDFWNTDRGEQQLVGTSWPTWESTKIDWGAGNVVLDSVFDRIKRTASEGVVVGPTTAGHTLAS